MRARKMALDVADRLRYTAKTYAVEWDDGGENARAYIREAKAIESIVASVDALRAEVRRLKREAAALRAALDAARGK